MARKRRGRAVDGVLLLHKDAGMTSNGALQRAKRLYFAAKAGHTGALDPLATGVLPICLGESTKFSQFLLDADKRYRSTFRLGAVTDTADADGDVIAQQDPSAVTREQVEAALEPLRGDIEQIPPMYSALKHQGQPLYKLAREGVEIERKARAVTVFELTLLDFRAGPEAEVDVEIHCSKGTYVRTIAEDIGRSLGCGAHVRTLHRAAAGPFNEADTVTLEALSEERGEGDAETLDHHLLAVDTPVLTLAAVTLPDSSAYYFGLGNPVMDGQAYRDSKEGDMVRVFTENSEFLGVGLINDEGLLAPKRLVAKA